MVLEQAFNDCIEHHTIDKNGFLLQTYETHTYYSCHSMRHTHIIHVIHVCMYIEIPLHTYHIVKMSVVVLFPEVSRL